LIAQQRASVMQQVSAITGKAAPAPASFFTVPFTVPFAVPWIDTTVASWNVPPCDPMLAGEVDKLIGESSTEAGVKPDLVRAVIRRSRETVPTPCRRKGRKA
jgi:hypothetical protein